MKRVKVRFTCKYRVDEGMTIPVMRTTQVVNEGVVAYHNSMHKRIGLTRIALNLLDYLTEIMDAKTNLVHNNSGVRNAYAEMLHGATGKKVGEDAIKAGFKQLSEKGLLVYHGQRGSFWVNPLHYYKGTQANRVIVLKELFEKPLKYPHSRSNILKAMPMPKLKRKKKK